MKSKINWIIFLFIVVGLVIGLTNIDLFFPISTSSIGTISFSPEKINFQKFLKQKQKLPVADPEVSLIAVGDISYSRGIDAMIKKYQDFNYPLREVDDYFKKTDLVFGNLETPITPGPQVFSGEMVFRSDIQIAEVLANSGFSILSLANNHTPNWGEKGLLDTFEYLNQAQIDYVGAGENLTKAYEPKYLERKGLKFAFLAYNDTDVVPDYYGAGKERAGTAFMNQEKMEAAVQVARQQADFVIVSMHSGNEYVFHPNQNQVDFAHAAIDAGADLVLGHHPHVVQTMEEYKDRFIFYSLGNFVFDQNWSAETSESLILKFYFNQKGLKQISFVPVEIKNNCQPQLADLETAQKILERLDFPLDKQEIYYSNDLEKDFKSTELAVLYLQESNPALSDYQVKKADLDKDNISEVYSLHQGKLIVTEDSEVLWQSSPEWWIDSFQIADSDHDGQLNLNISLWKAGDFGSSQPFWIDKNDPSVKNHFFVFKLNNDQIQMVWGSSNLSYPNCEFEFADLDGDDQVELIVLEGEYTEDFFCEAKYLAVWKWQEWGFYNLWRSLQGDYSDLETIKFGEQEYIMFNKF